ncbi:MULTISPECIES: IDEAL domain-containing protein [Paenibacillus]|uniref:IDEAL domain-containing protein n=1 Tax=Paenibacillus TaxID=44249 RepID=UPI0003613AD7|nr:IDEAL domain-containing protein [Paenibacillus massiliensis]
MLTLNKAEIIDITRKQLAKVMRLFPIELKFTNDFGRERPTAAQKFSLTNQHYSAKVMDCVLEHEVRPILMCEIIYFLKCEYMDGTVDLRLDYDLREGMEQAPSATAVITFDDTAELDIQDLEILIDLALQMNDKHWFKELMYKYTEMQR